MSKNGKPLSHEEVEAEIARLKKDLSEAKRERADLRAEIRAERQAWRDEMHAEREAEKRRQNLRWGFWIMLILILMGGAFVSLPILAAFLGQ